VLKLKGQVGLTSTITMNNKYPFYFLILSLCSLMMGLFFGLSASLQYIFPELFKNFTPFSMIRPLHVTSVLSWILLGAIGSIYFFLNKKNSTTNSNRLLKFHFFLYLLLGIIIIFSYFMGYMTGREYLAFSPVLIIPILLGWVIFGIIFFKTLLGKIKNWPVYYWMWGTGIVFMIYHLCEAQLWLLDDFRDHFTKNMTVQWKSYGSFTGSWNMLVYGISIYVMSKITDNKAMVHSKKVFFFFYLGLINLMFGWAHHTYFLPSPTWVRYLAYIVSMLEWIVLISIIYDWKQTLKIKENHNYHISVKFLKTTDLWIFLNLLLALLISIPAVNYFTHGTHITVAHSMGTTIGINTTILFSSFFYIVGDIKLQNQKITNKIKKGLLFFNISLMSFILTLLIAGVKKSYWTHYSDSSIFSRMQDSQYFVYVFLFLSGICLATSIYMIVIPLLKKIIRIVND